MEKILVITAILLFAVVFYAGFLIGVGWVSRNVLRGNLDKSSLWNSILEKEIKKFDKQ